VKAESERVQWEEDEVEGPDVEDRETLLTLAKMTYDAYIEPTDDDWYDLGGDWLPVCSAITYLRKGS
jgi:putative lipase involved disintegration of autophagic bodies